MFFRIVGQVSVTMLKTALLLGILIAALTVILCPSFALALSVHWSLGLIYGVVSLILVISLLITLSKRAKSEEPVWDWLLRS